MANRALIFDMDGTIANLYGVEGWLSDLTNESVRPYEVCEPMYNMNELSDILTTLKEEHGYQIIVTTWTAKDGSQAYNKAVRYAKINWLKSHNFPYDIIHCVKYGTTKANCTRKLGGFQILIDDNDKVRDGWTLGSTIDAKFNIIPELQALLEK